MVEVDVSLESDCNCAFHGVNAGGKGLTIWTSENVTLQPTESHTWSFTETRPHCYYGTDVCLIFYEFATAPTDNATSDVVLGRKLNGNIDIYETIHSRTGGHNVNECFDLSIVNGYNDGDDGGENSVTFTNQSPIPIQINGFRVIRGYTVYGFTSQEYCTGAVDNGSSGNLDSTRIDFPCNCDSYGPRISHTKYKDTVITTIPHGGSAIWNIIHPDYYAPPTTSDHENYVEKYICIFNFNNVRKHTYGDNDLHYHINLNGHTIADYYHGGVSSCQSQFPSVDLAQSEWYVDTPGATNTVEFCNDSTNTDLDLDTTSLGGVDIYRFYKVKNICQDNFEDIYFSNIYWDPLEVNGSTNDTNHQLFVDLSSGSGCRQAGYVTKYSYDSSIQQGFEAAIDVVQINCLDEMSLLISNQKTTISDPWNLNNWYRITKGSNETITVTRSVNGTRTQRYQTAWNLSTGQLKIIVSNGYVAFYENGIRRYSESYVLPSPNCYIYAYTSSSNSGTGSFDNFSLTSYPDEHSDVIIYTDTSPGGSIAPSGGVSGMVDVAYNGTPTFTITPNSGYTIDDVQVNGNSIGAVSSYTFNPVQSNQTIYASFFFDCSCQLGCQTCYGPAYCGGSQIICHLSCQTCDTQCDICETCYNTCDTCDGCYNGCYWGCEIACQECYTVCQGCNAGCDTCYGCYSCYTCDAGQVNGSNLTVDAVLLNDESSLAVDVNIDGNYQGTTEVVKNLALGTYTIAVPYIFDVECVYSVYLDETYVQGQTGDNGWVFDVTLTNDNHTLTINYGSSR